jgi:hypothetical protein
MQMNVDGHDWVTTTTDVLQGFLRTEPKEIRFARRGGKQLKMGCADTVVAGRRDPPPGMAF